MTTLQQYVDQYERLRSRRGAEPAWLRRLRRDALESFLARGFPTTRDEEWRFTSVAPIAAEPFILAPPAAPSGDLVAGSWRLPGAASAELVFIDGRYAAELSTTAPLSPGVRVENLDAGVASGELESELTSGARGSAFSALNTAFLSDGAFIRIPPGTILEAPIHLLFVSTGHDGTPTMSHPRVRAEFGSSSQATLVETYAGAAGRYFTNAVTELIVGENAVVDHYKRQYEAAAAFHVGAMHVQAGRSANVSSHSVSVGGALVRNDVVAVLDGEGADCTLNGLYIADAQRLVDNHTTIDHAQPHCASRETYKGILAGRARGIFNGKIIVRPDAQKTDAKQTNRALLLSEDAQINTKPQLEIYANDVKCTHGAAVGQLDDEAMFYLRSRGVSASDARHLLIRAFAAEVLSRMRLEAVRHDAETVLLERLARALPAAA